eukprot:scaffold75534_cov18-Tisochrysis_lutea.AAC.1
MSGQTSPSLKVSVRVCSETQKSHASSPMVKSRMSQAHLPLGPECHDAARLGLFVPACCTQQPREEPLHFCVSALGET